MDPISFALALAQIPAIFTSCVDCYQYIQFGREFERDFGLTLCKLEASALRLTRWGTAMGIDGPDSQLRADRYGEEEIKSAYHWLQQIRLAFDTAREASARLEKAAAKQEKSRVLDTNTELVNAGDSLKALQSTMRRIIDGRLKPRKRDRVTWALYGRTNYENLVEKISELVNNLVELFPSMAPAEGLLCRNEVEEMSLDSLKLFENIIDEKDKVLKNIYQIELERRIIRVGEVQATDDFMCHIGDNVEFANQASSIDIKAINASGRAILHIDICHEARTVAFESGRIFEDEKARRFDFSNYTIHDGWLDTLRDSVHLNWKPFVDIEWGHYDMGDPVRSLLAHAVHTKSQQASLMLGFLQSMQSRQNPDEPHDHYRWTRSELADLMRTKDSWTVVVLEPVIVHTDVVTACELFGVLGDARVQIIHVDEEARLRTFLEFEKNPDVTFGAGFAPEDLVAAKNKLRAAVEAIFGSEEQAPIMRPAVMFRLCVRFMECK
ncbi:hypothetical protein FE257_003749 [Aspergillus nanangensis]|uniref:Prion-inhibition and propagation HeLo domain-containing protein n=1 Tax=Aspergillus nanangensis TaxID=2582783 RepID=A0AAD4GNG7_ASPNN|nr:hypothetical protein FE257_003749 [Aspergillus nanangensis]